LHILHLSGTGHRHAARTSMGVALSTDGNGRTSTCVAVRNVNAARSWRLVQWHHGFKFNLNFWIRNLNLK